MKSKMRKSDLVIEDLAEDLKLLPWQSLQGIKDDRLLIFVLSRVVALIFVIFVLILFISYNSFINGFHKILSAFVIVNLDEF